MKPSVELELYKLENYKRKINLLTCEMASSATIDSQQPLPHSHFAAHRLGRSSQSIHARLLRFWDSFKGITLLFLDEKDSMINGIIPAEQANHYRRSLQEGDIYRVAHFEVGICPHMYKSTEHTFLIRFLQETTIDPIINNCPHISLQKFMVRNYEQLQILACLDDNTENATWPLSSIGDLSYFLSNPTDQTQEPYFVCKARIVDVLGQHGWYYVCCTQCSKEMVKSAASLRCDQCGNTNDTGVVRYRVELLVDDGNNYATFVVFDKEMLEMTNQHAATLFLSEVNVGLDDKLPQCVSGLEGQTFVFHIRVKPCNSTQNYSPFTVSAISHNIDTKDFNIKESPCVDLRCDEPSTPPPANNTLTAEVQEGERSCSRE
ncbi:hypothetical protein Bca4012_045610 [Brassica carinata]